MSKHDDKRLRELYRRYRQPDEQSAPLFVHVLARAQARRKPVRHQTMWRLALVVGVAAMLVLGLLRLRHLGEQSETDYGFTRWKSPTAFLLDTPATMRKNRLDTTPSDVLLRLPGQRLLRTTPKFGGTGPVM